MIDLSIIIVNWNTRDLLAQCLESVISSQSPVISDQLSVVSRKADLVTDDWLLMTEVFVVDNASTDGSAAMVRQHFPRVQLIENRHNVGFAKANNQAIVRATGRFIALLNSDTIVLPGSLDLMVEFMDSRPEVGAAGFKLLDSQGHWDHGWGSFPTVLSEAVPPRVHRWWERLRGIDHASATEPVEVDWVGGAGIVVRREVVAQVGSLDERFFMYAEETDWCYRIKRNGWRVFGLPSAQVVHLGGQSSQSVSDEARATLYRSKCYFFEKNYGSFWAFLLKIILSGRFLLAMGWESLALAMRGSRRMGSKLTSRRALFKALWGMP